ncbi:MAG: hypothetical protein VSS75_004865 [Candidatus Parabeggiatoa sp.]|nr:hypothetical protein [Candidatus Parabeggiatoa sp.]
MIDLGQQIVGNSLADVWTRYVWLTHQGTMGVDDGQAIRELFSVTVHFTPQADFEAVHPLMDMARQVQYIKKMCAKDNRTIEQMMRELGGSYADRIFNRPYGNQFETAVRQLIQRSESKSAIINLLHPLEWEQKIQPAINRMACLTHIQALIRDQQLHFVAHFRSQNVWHAHGNFKALHALQSLMLSRLKEKGLKVNQGGLTISIVAAHLYEPDFKQAEHIAKELALANESC